MLVQSCGSEQQKRTTINGHRSGAQRRFDGKLRTSAESASIRKLKSAQCMQDSKN
jgi:hypothetical protein